MALCSQSTTPTTLVGQHRNALFGYHARRQRQYDQRAEPPVVGHAPNVRYGPGLLRARRYLRAALLAHRAPALAAGAFFYHDGDERRELLKEQKLLCAFASGDASGSCWR
jgi:hypothetical protein